MYDDDTGEITRTKVLTTAQDQSEGTVAALTALAGDLSRIDAFHHGYTVGINAALTRNGAKAGMLVTEGHRDIVDTGRIWRPFDENLYDPTWERPHLARPLVSRRHRREVPERLGQDGSVLLELDEDATRRELEFLKAEGVESIGICFINAYAHPEHEDRVREIVEEVIPGAYVQSSRIWPLAREFERSFVVMLDAYAGPPIVKYVERLEKRLEEAGFDSRLEIMQMDGGLRSAPAVRDNPVFTLQSGPVAGLLGAEFYSRELLEGQGLICLDIGGTSSDIGIVHGGKATVTNEWQLEHAMPLAITTLDVRSIGAGGGSLIQIDDLGSLSVGPESAGSEPGPACYGRGGTQPAMTDAYLSMGLLQPELFLAGQMTLDSAAAETALTNVAERAGMSAVDLAQGAYHIANTMIAAATRAMAVESGLDLRDFALLAYGAAGPMHSVGVARELGIPEVVVPYFPGGFSAFGMIASRSRVEYSRATMQSLEALGVDTLNELTTELGKQAKDDLRAQGVADDDITMEFFYYGMYTGQGEPNRLPLTPVPMDDDGLVKLAADFHAFYLRRFGYEAPEIPIRVTSVSAVATGPNPELDLTLGAMADAGTRTNGTGKQDPVVLRKTVHLDGKRHDDTPFYDRSKLAEGDVVEGPAVIDDQLGTIVVNEGATANVEAHGTLRIKV
jgi:N-methylhydantoinase A